MRLEQAIFTSMRSERLDGYQLAARSDGITSEVARELTAWGPAHDSLWSNRLNARSVNFHPLGGPQVCISLTTLSGGEYSGRGGGRVYTQMLVVPLDGLERFAGDPFLLLQAVGASGRLVIHDNVPNSLPSVPLLGRSVGPATHSLEQTIEQVGAEAIANLAEAFLASSSLSVVTDIPAERLFQTVLYQLPLEQRLNLSFTTGLKFSSRRPFRICTVPADPALIRQSQRLTGGKTFEIFTEDVSLSRSF